MYTRMYIHDCDVMSECINYCRLYNKRLCINIIFCMNVNYKDERSASVSVALYGHMRLIILTGENYSEMYT